MLAAATIVKTYKKKIAVWKKQPRKRADEWKNFVSIESENGLYYWVIGCFLPQRSRRGFDAFFVGHNKLSVKLESFFSFLFSFYGYQNRSYCDIL